MHYFYPHISRNCLYFSRKALPFLLIISYLFLSACSQDTADEDKQLSADSSASTEISNYTLSPELNTIYRETCIQCHTNSSTGAPISGDTKAWQKILSKGLEATLERAMNGYGGMPPAGQCFECTPEQMIDLINYMSQRS